MRLEEPGTSSTSQRPFWHAACGKEIGTAVRRSEEVFNVVLRLLRVGSWMFAIGWFLGAIYVQNQDEKMEGPRVVEQAEVCPECEAWRLPAVASVSAD